MTHWKRDSIGSRMTSIGTIHQTLMYHYCIAINLTPVLLVNEQADSATFLACS